MGLFCRCEFLSSEAQNHSFSIYCWRGGHPAEQSCALAGIGRWSDSGGECGLSDFLLITSSAATPRKSRGPKWASPNRGPRFHHALGSVPGLASEQIRRFTRGKDAQTQSACLAREHGWGGRGLGVGKRISLKNTRAIIAIHSGALAQAKTEREPVFGFEIVCDVPDVPREILLPRQSWANKSAYDTTAEELAGLFNKNFETYAPGASAEVKAAAPKM